MVTVCKLESLLVYGEAVLWGQTSCVLCSVKLNTTISSSPVGLQMGHSLNFRHHDGTTLASCPGYRIFEKLGTLCKDGQLPEHWSPSYIPTSNKLSWGASGECRGWGNWAVPTCYDCADLDGIGRWSPGLSSSGEQPSSWHPSRELFRWERLSRLSPWI